jgi:hypothetical protein
MMASYLELVAKVPVHELRYDHDFHRLPLLLDTIESVFYSNVEITSRIPKTP